MFDSRPVRDSLRALALMFALFCWGFVLVKGCQ
jgi:hypothetical protein